MAKKKLMKICFFSKYPPIEGGVSSKTYWLSRALGKRGVEVHIVTNALAVEKEYRQNIDFASQKDLKEYQPENVFVHSVKGPASFRAPFSFAYFEKLIASDEKAVKEHRYDLIKEAMFFHIPFSPAYLERLISLGVKVIKEHRCSLIDSYYFQPYGLAAVFSKILTSKPCILRHAGSDISKLFLNEELHDLYKNVFKFADIITTGSVHMPVFKACGIADDKLWPISGVAVDSEYFNPKIKPADLLELGVPARSLKKPVLLYLGKFSTRKGLAELVQVAAEVKDDFLLLFVTGGGGLKEFEERVASIRSLKNKYCFLNFLPPWKIPGLLRASDCLIHLENNFPVKPHSSHQPLEAMACGTPVLMSEDICRSYPNLKKNEHALVADPNNHNDLKSAFLKIVKNTGQIKRIGQKGHQEIFGKKEFEKSVASRLSLYRKLLKS